MAQSEGLMMPVELVFHQQNVLFNGCKCDSAGERGLAPTGSGKGLGQNGERCAGKAVWRPGSREGAECGWGWAEWNGKGGRRADQAQEEGRNGDPSRVNVNLLVQV